MTKILIVGAGLSGTVVARQLAEAKHKVTVIDKRPHIGGNCFDFVNEIGILVHKYGPHLFHTSNKNVVEWLSRFTEWIEYKHKVKAMLSNGKLVSFPVNLDTLKEVDESKIIDTFFRPYTKKMWNMELEDLDPSIIQRVPVRKDHNDLYFPDDSYQLMPKYGYTELFKSIFNHRNIYLSLGTPWTEEMISDYDLIFTSMPIDEFCGYSKGHLPYRSIKFHTYTVPVPNLFPVTTINFTHNGPYTRVTEWKNIYKNMKNDKAKYATTITIEEPCSDSENNFEKFYPVKDLSGINNKRYQEYIHTLPKKVIPIGRCGLYKYLDMDEAIERALNISQKILSKIN